MILISELDEFYSDIISIADKIKVFPATIDQLMYDPRYNDPYVIDILKETEVSKDDPLEEIDSFYRVPIRILCNSAMYVNALTYIGDSDEVGDQFESGDFNYYMGFINNECPFMYHESSHMFAFPSRIVIYSPKYQIEVSSYKKEIDVYESVPSTRRLFFIKNPEERFAAVKLMLRNSDRPRLDI